MSQEVTIIAAFSAFFYLSLAVVSAFYYRKFRRIQLESPLKDTYYHCKFGRYDSPKVSFFLVLCISALLDSPMYLFCLFEGGPHDCEWDSMSYAVSWFLHLIAVCGYAYTIMIPCILWNDIIRNRDGKLFFSLFPADRTKRFFQVSLALYVLNTVVDVLSAIIEYRVSDHNHFTDSNEVDNYCTFTEPIIIFAITVGCFSCGLRLQRYVMKAKLGFNTEMRFLLHLNVPMLMIMCTYLMRAVFVLRFVKIMPDAYANGISPSYLVWMIFTRWLPYIVCSLVLVLMMRFSGAEVAAKHSKQNSEIAGITDSPLHAHKSFRAKSMRAALRDSERAISTDSVSALVNEKGEKDPRASRAFSHKSQRKKGTKSETSSVTHSQKQSANGSVFGEHTQDIDGEGGEGEDQMRSSSLHARERDSVDISLSHSKLHAGAYLNFPAQLNRNSHVRGQMSTDSACPSVNLFESEIACTGNPLRDEEEGEYEEYGHYDADNDGTEAATERTQSRSSKVRRTNPLDSVKERSLEEGRAGKEEDDDDDEEEDEYFRTSFRGDTLNDPYYRDEQPSSLESIVTRDFSVDFFLQQTVLLEVARTQSRELQSFPTLW